MSPALTLTRARRKRSFGTVRLSAEVSGIMRTPGCPSARRVRPLIRAPASSQSGSPSSNRRLSAAGTTVTRSSGNPYAISPSQRRSASSCEYATTATGPCSSPASAAANTGLTGGASSSTATRRACPFIALRIPRKGSRAEMMLLRVPSGIWRISRDSVRDSGAYTRQRPRARLRRAADRFHARVWHNGTDSLAMGQSGTHRPLSAGAYYTERGAGFSSGAGRLSGEHGRHK